MGRYLSPRSGHVILISDILFSQLSTDHNISFPVLPNQLESVRLNIGFPVVQTDGRCTDT